MFPIATLLLLALLIVVLLKICLQVPPNFKAVNKDIPPGPRQFPVIGSLLFMARYKSPLEAFSALHSKYGEIVSLKLGSLDCIVVSGLDAIRQVLVTRSQYFDSRPGFSRFHMLFDNNKDNSMAFSDWSESLRRKREIVGHHTFPKCGTDFFENLNSIATEEVAKMIKKLNEHLISNTNESTSHSGVTVHLKPYFIEFTFRIFIKYFCNMDLPETEDGQAKAKDAMKAFDDVFQEVNSQCIGDLFPSLMPLCGKSHLPVFGEIIRDFTMSQCVQPRLALLNHRIRRSLPDITFDSLSSTSTDCSDSEDLEAVNRAKVTPQRNSISKMEGFVAADIQQMFKIRSDTNNEEILTNGFISRKSNTSGITSADSLLDEFLLNIGRVEGMNLDNALYAFEDILGGHSAISNFLSTVSLLLAQNPSAQEGVRKEVAASIPSFRAGNNDDIGQIKLDHKLPYSECVVWECARKICSPLVPHVANQDTTIGNYKVKQGTIFFLNNADLNFSKEHWDLPEEFNPSRFLNDEGRVLKPDYFLPFGSGRRSCLGFKILQFVSSLVVSSLCSNFQLEKSDSTSPITPGTLAVKGLGHSVQLKPLDYTY